ncbi:Putative serine/threonine-protein kinase, active [Septoria linicola]|uniref:Serine/threonine-protein kinase, active n=1 Tax=Septoria linicola TaxID=215465 RepID=A0A9Q9ENA2_9PEZI|nr:putative serine/threonine-protein kinase, active [Septoria linicola]USW56354.1 Putative serine/threonine-protein kinase, active [Septoria linicola]
MAQQDELIDFSIIEASKENIQAIPSGRSARALAQLYSPPLLGAQASPNDQHAGKRAQFETELANIDEADDPLDVYDRYVKWTMDTYPSAQATPQSQLLPLLERATKAFQSSKDYKNDVRYLKIWLHYIRFFSDAPREVFVFLARHGIGERLALYYEEFAAWLENAGRWSQAEEIYKMGIEKEARPSERLMRKFGEFERRMDARPEDATEPSSPALPAARPALAAKTDPFAATPSPAQQQQSRATGGSKKPKMAIFTDSGEDSRPASGNSSKGWDTIGTLADRKKENTTEAKPMAGQKLMAGKTNTGMQKMMIFKDQSSRSMPRHLSSHSSSSSNHDQQCVFNERTGRLECVFVNLEAVYPEAGNLAMEYCFEELRARHRGWLNKDGKRSKIEKQKTLAKNDSFDIQLDTPTPLQDNSTEEKDEKAPVVKPVTKEKPFKIFSDAEEETPESRPTPKQKAFEIFEDTDLEPKQQSRDEQPALAAKFTKTLALNDENDENTPPSKQEMDAAKKARREERANRTRKIKVMEVKHIKNETQTIKLNMDSPPKSKPKRRKSVAPEPTMTINTKEAMDEIYGIFSAPLPSQSEQQPEEESEEDSSDESEDDEDDYTIGDESTATGKLSAPASEYGDETRNELLDAQRDDDRTDVSAWSDFDTGKHVPKEEDDSGLASAQTTQQDVYDQTDEAVTPVDQENPQTRYVPVAPEDYEPPVMQMRNMNMLPNHRLPFMTPIVEQTESSLGIPTQRPEKDYFGAKTPSRKNGMTQDFDDEEDEEPPSSPFDDVTADMEEDKRRVLQPIRTKSTKGTLSLGQGTSKAQIDAKFEAPATADAVQKGPIVKDLQCNPMDPYLRQSILSQMQPSLTTYEGYHEHLDAVSGKTAEIKKYIKQLQASRKSQSQTQEKTTSIPPMVAFPGAGGIYTIKRELGAGTFAPVYLVENSAAASLEEREDLLGDDEDEQEVSNASRLGKLTHRRPLEAIKMEEPPSTWEFYILRATHRRLGVSRASESIVKAHEMHLFRDECFLVEEYRDQGTLLDLVNIARLESGSGGGMDEMLAMFFSIELLRTVEAMHTKNLIHGDLKGDNVLVRFDDPGMETDWSPTYFPSGAHGWSAKGVCLIDFGRGIDMKHFEEKVAFIADWKTSEADCAEMRELRPWTYQIDYHGLAGIVHSLLFGKYMETSADKNASLGHGATKTYRIRESFKRYWQTEIWAELFALLLNPLSHVEHEDGKRMPVVRSLRSCRERMETWLEENCERGIGLKGMISRMEGAIREKKRRSVRS